MVNKPILQRPDLRQGLKPGFHSRPLQMEAHELDIFGGVEPH